MRVIVMGASGFLGAHVYKSLVSHHSPCIHLVGTCSMRPDSEGFIPVDLASAAMVRGLVHEVKPDVVIWCVKARDNADEMNLHRVGLTRIVKEVGTSSRIIFSDAVLPGTKGHYDEETVPAPSLGSSPLDRYINAKIEAETVVRELCSDFCIVRTGPIFGPSVSGAWDSRISGILSALERGERLERPVNLVRTYCHVADLADSLCELLVSNVQGVLHVGAKAPVSHFEFAMAVAQRFGYSVDPLMGFEISQDDADRRHVRLNTSMDTRRAVKFLATRLRDVDEALAGESMQSIR